MILLGRYLPVKLLGRGGFGAAFLARDRYTPAMRKCVVKQFQPSGDLSPSQLQVAQNLFEREGEVLEELGNKHGQIPDLLAFFDLTLADSAGIKDNQFFYLVQEFIDGQNMEEELAQKGTFSEAEVLEVLAEISNVLEFVHENHSIHRDIKPSNVMRDRRGRLYLLDFGAVKQVTKVPASGGQAAASTGIYSMGFAPPEQMSGGTVYPSTDLYALAVTCLTLLTGKSPMELYDSYSNTWNWRSHVQVSDRLAEVLDRMLLPTPSQRFGSAAEVLEALKNQTGLTTGGSSYPPLPVSSSPASPPPPVPVSPPTTTQAPLPSPPPPPPPVAQPASQPVAQAPQLAPPPTRSAFSTLELLGEAAFTGFEGSLLAIALGSMLGTTLLGTGFWILLLGVLVFVQSRRIIERVDLLIIAAITLAVILFFPPLRAVPFLRGENPMQTVLFVAILSALVSVAVTALFRLIYKLLSMF